MSDDIPLYNKYRPTTLDDIVGHKTIVKSLKKVLDDGRQRSFLFTGGSGLGKTTLARIVAHYLCGGEASDQNLIERNGADVTGVDAARDLVKSLQMRALGHSPLKIVVYDEVHKISNSAWSSLLKPIEEPPPHVYWCLCTTEAGKVPKTIKTRCVHYDLKPLKDDDILDILNYVAEQEELETPEEVIEAIAENSDGSPRQALANLELCAYSETASQARSEMRKAYEAEPMIQLARLLIGRQGRNWAKAIALVNSFENTEAESIRIMIVRYFSGALLKAKKDGEAKRLLATLECFSEPYQQSDGLGPLLMSIGEALGLGE